MSESFASRRRTYFSWRSMKLRCTDPANPRFSDYGGRGIHICDEWLLFANFLRDMGFRPAGLTLERIDNSKGYSPDNCKWATYSEQAVNRRNTRMITANGKTQSMRHWERELGLSRGALSQRLRRGWSPSEVATESIRPSELIKWAARNRGVRHGQ